MSIIKYNKERGSNNKNNNSSSASVPYNGITIAEIEDNFLPAKPTDEEKTKYDVEVEGTFKKNVTLPSIMLKSADGTKTASITLDDNGNILIDKSVISRGDLVAYGVANEDIDTVESLIRRILEDGEIGGGGINWGGVSGDGNAITSLTYNADTKTLSATKDTKFATEKWVTDKGYLTQHQSLVGYATETWVNNKGYLTQHQDISGKSNTNHTHKVKINGVDKTVTASDSSSVVDLGSYLPTNGGSLYGALVMAGTTGSTALIEFSRKVTESDTFGVNYITYPIEGSLAIGTHNTSSGIVGLFDASSFRPYTTNKGTLGTSNRIWNAVYANTFYGALSGNADTATTAEKVQKESHSSSTKYYVNFSPTSSSKIGYNESFTYTPSTNTVEANIKGNADTATKLASIADGSADADRKMLVLGADGKIYTSPNVTSNYAQGSIKGKKVQITDGTNTATLTINSNGIYVDKPIICQGDVVAYGVTTTEIDSVQDLIVNYINEHKAEFGSIDNVVVATATGTGNVITSLSASLSADKRTITLTPNKGITALTSHQDISGKADKTHTHSVKINGTTKTIPASGGTAVDLGTYLTSHQSLDVSRYNFGTASTVSIKQSIYTLSAVNHLNWGNQNSALIDKGALAYWNGRYNSTSSNLLYFKNGEIDSVSARESAISSAISTEVTNRNTRITNYAGYLKNARITPNSIGVTSAGTYTIAQIVSGNHNGHRITYRFRLFLQKQQAQISYVDFAVTLREVSNGYSPYNNAYNLMQIESASGFDTSKIYAKLNENNDTCFIGFDASEQTNWSQWNIQLISISPFLTDTTNVTLPMTLGEISGTTLTNKFGPYKLTNSISGNADTATTAEKVQKESHSSSNKYYVNFSSTSASKMGYNESFTYTPSTNTIEATVNGNASSATKLATSRTLWGQSFNGTANVSGAISNTGNITPSTTATSTIGSTSLYYSGVYANAYRGNADVLYITNTKADKDIAFLANNSTTGNNVERMRISGLNGNVAIGTSVNADQKLRVNGVIRGIGRAMFDGVDFNGNTITRLTNVYYNGANTEFYFLKSGDTHRTRVWGVGYDGSGQYEQIGMSTTTGNSRVNLKNNKGQNRLLVGTNGAAYLATDFEDDTAWSNNNVYLLNNNAGYTMLATTTTRNSATADRTIYIRPSGLTSSTNQSTFKSTGVTINGSSADTLVIKRTAANSGAFINFYANNQSTNYWRIGSNSTSQCAFAYNGTVKTTIETNGDITSVGNILATSGESASDRYVSVFNSNGGVRLYTSTNRGLYDATLGKWIINTIKADSTVGINGGKVTIDNNGNVVASGDVTAYSDKRLKSEIKPLEYRGAIEPKEYVKDGKKSIGFIAQEVRELYPELVLGEESENSYLSLNYGGISAVLAAENKELRNKVSKLEDRISKLESLIDKLMNK